MANTKITALSAAASIIATDILPVVVDPGGAATTKKITVANLITSLNTAAVGTEVEVAFALDGLGAGGTAPAIVRLGSSYGWGFTINDDGYFSFEIPVNWDGASAFEILLHVYINEAYATRSGEIRFTATWTATSELGTETIDAPTHTGTLDSGDINIPATAKTLIEINMGTIAAASLAAHDVVSILIKRVALVGGTNPVAEPVIVQAEYEYTRSGV